MKKHSDALRMLKQDPHFAPLIQKHGPPDLTRYHGKMRIFSAILRSIIFQQISGSAARAIQARFLALFPKSGPTPGLVLKSSVIKMRSAGLSVQKIAYMKDAAKKFKDGIIKDRDFKKMTSQEIIDHLVQIKGVGVWTAHMLLIFTLHRVDILPTGDLGVQKGFQAVYKLRSLPSHKHMERLAKPWREHASIGSWYLWRAADDAKKKLN